MVGAPVGDDALHRAVVVLVRRGKSWVLGHGELRVVVAVEGRPRRHAVGRPC